VLDFNGDRKFYTGTLAGARPGWSRAYPDAVALTEAQAAKLAGRFHAGFLLPPGTHDGHTIDVVRDYGLATEARL
jgi:hypothetical protein